MKLFMLSVAIKLLTIDCVSISQCYETGTVFEKIPDQLKQVNVEINGNRKISILSCILMYR